MAQMAQMADKEGEWKRRVGERETDDGEADDGEADDGEVDDREKEMTKDAGQVTDRSG